MYFQPIFNSNWQEKRWHQFWWLLADSRTWVVILSSFSSCKAPNLTAGCSRNDLDFRPGEPYSSLGWMWNYIVQFKKIDINDLLPSLLHLHALAGGEQKFCSFISCFPSLLPNRTSRNAQVQKIPLKLCGWRYKREPSKAISTWKHLHRCPIHKSQAQGLKSTLSPSQIL